MTEANFQRQKSGLLDTLNTQIRSGAEFPDAMASIALSNHLSVPQAAAMVEAYDGQFSTGNGQ